MNSIPPIQKTYQTTQQSFKDRWNQQQKKKPKTEDKPQDISTNSEELSTSKKVWYC